MISKIKKIFRYINFVGGLNTYTSPSDVDNNQSPSLKNVQPKGKGGVEKTSGTVVEGDYDTDAVVGTASYYANGAAELLKMNGTSLKKLVSGVWTSITGFTYTISKETNFVQISNVLLIHNAVDSMTKYDGTSITTPANGVIAQAGIEYRGFHYAIGNSSNPDTLYRSTAADPADFVGTSPDVGETYQVGIGDGQKITGLAKWGDYLIIFKERSSYYLSITYSSTGDVVTTIKLINPVLGAVCHRAIDNVEDDVYFLSYEGLYVLGNEPNFFNVIRTRELSASITDKLRDLQPDKIVNSSAIYHNHKLRLSVAEGGSSVNNLELIVDRNYNNSWWVETGRNVNCYNQYISADGAYDLYYGDDVTGKVYKFDKDITTNDGTEIEAQYTSKVFSHGDQESYKRYKDVWFEFKESSGSVVIEIWVNGDNKILDKTVNLSKTPTSAGWGTGLWGTIPLWGKSITVSSSGSVGDTTIVHYNLGTLGVTARNINFRITQSTKGKFRLTAFKVKAFTKSEWEFNNR